LRLQLRVKSAVRTLPIVSGLVCLAVVWVGCGSATDSPLGGPFGGTASVTPSPGSGSSGGSDASASSGGDSGSASGSGSGSGGASGSGGSGSGSGSGATAPACTSVPPDAGGVAAPTWSALYTKYFAVNTIGNCAQVACHTEMGSASAAYTWLQQQTLECGPPNCIASISDCTSSVLSWFGGGMPVAGPTSEPQARDDINAWVAAGSKNN
jgi:hypothetical protein